MTPAWRGQAIGVYDRFLSEARAKGHLNSDVDVLNFLALAICGETGELANFIKKRWRGDNVLMSDIRDELADIRIYLEHISRELGIDLDEACERKLGEVAARLDARRSPEISG